MLSGFSHQHDNTAANGHGRGADVYRALTDYMDSPIVMKDVAGTKVEVVRDPAPEILHGRADSLRRSIAVLPFQRKYRFGLLSFAQSDVDVEAFNAGELVARRQVDLALGLFVQTLWPGIPAPARPGYYVTTHTHTGRLEVNIALPRAVFAGERPFGYNPHPPTPFGEAPWLWQAMRDVVNARFGWADPEDPARRHNLARPDWQLKLEAEARRAGLQPEIDQREDLLNLLLAEVDAGHIASRNDVIACLQNHVSRQGWSVLGQTRNSITVGDPAAPVKDRLRLRGRVFDAEFSGKLWLNDPAFLAAQSAARGAELAAAPQRFMAAWDSRAAFNVARYGKGDWPHPAWDISHWLAEDSAALPKLIPFRHHAITRPLKGYMEANHDTSDTPGASVSGLDGPYRSGSHRPLERPAGADRGIGNRQPDNQTGDGADPARVAGLGGADAATIERIGLLEQHARQISGPAGIGAALAHIAEQLKTYSAHLGALVAQTAVTRLIPGGLSARLAKTTTHLEMMHDRQRYGHLYAGSNADLGTPAPLAGTLAFDSASVGRNQRADARRAHAEPDSGSSILGEFGRAAGAYSERSARSGAEGTDPARRTGGDGQAHQQDHGSNGAPGKLVDRSHRRAARPGLTAGASLGDVLRVSRRVLRALDSNRAGSLGRINGGFQLRAPGVSLEIRGNSVDIRRWDLSQKRLSATLEFIARLLDVAAISPSLAGHSSLPDDQVARPPEAQTIRSFVNKKWVGDPDAFAAVLPQEDAEGSMPGADDEGPHVS